MLIFSILIILFGQDISIPNSHVVEGAETYSFETKWGSFGSGSGQSNVTNDLKDPVAIAIDPSSGDIYVAESKMVKRFAPDGNLKEKFDEREEEEDIHPTDIAVDSSGNVYLAALIRRWTVCNFASC